MLTFVVMRDVVQGLVYVFVLTFVVMRDVVQGLVVRFCVDVCCYARCCSRTCTFLC